MNIKELESSQDGSFANKQLKAVFYGGRYDGLMVNHEELEKLGNGKFTIRFSVLDGHNPRMVNLDLEDQPLVSGYVGPMFDGGMLRYETQKIYDLMFD